MYKNLKWLLLLLCLLALRFAESRASDSLSVRKEIMALIREGLLEQSRSEKSGTSQFSAALKLADSLKMSDL